MNSLIGFFINEQKKPEYDPKNVFNNNYPCLICFGNLIGKEQKTISLLKEGDDKSYFYRVHKFCYEGLSDKVIKEIEDNLIDGI